MRKRNDKTEPAATSKNAVKQDVCYTEEVKLQDFVGPLPTLPIERPTEQQPVCERVGARASFSLDAQSRPLWWTPETWSIRRSHKVFRFVLFLAAVAWSEFGRGVRRGVATAGAAPDCRRHQLIPHKLRHDHGKIGNATPLIRSPLWEECSDGPIISRPHGRAPCGSSEHPYTAQLRLAFQGLAKPPISCVCDRRSICIAPEESSQKQSSVLMCELI
ncbi:hypothetical protein OPT61_g575 [Boeremia exigua]|uniref:Uncharacterized protein n=1 Tax=Boeremia exigua TaxID=749465 RepID=A0ACC2IT95_9PLEO|nr:hypothetical protein OPT61_g575 [Boeremia exigua]